MIIPSIGLCPGMFIPKVSNGLLNGLISDFEFEETSGTTCTDSKGSNSGVITGCTLSQIGKTGKCYYFDGSTSYILKTTPSGFNSLSHGAISCWIKVDSVSGIHSIVCFTNRSTSYLYAEISINSRALYFFGKNITFYSGNILTVGGWHHVVVNCAGVADGNRMYFDGVEVSVTFDAGNLTTDEFLNDTWNRFNIGREHIYANGTNYYNYLFGGYIDELRIWNRALTTAEIAALYNSGNGIPFAQLTT